MTSDQLPHNPDAEAAVLGVILRGEASLDEVRREPLTTADAHEIASSMIGFFTALARCAKEAGQASAKIPGRHDAD